MTARTGPEGAAVGAARASERTRRDGNGRGVIRERLGSQRRFQDAISCASGLECGKPLSGSLVVERRIGASAAAPCPDQTLLELLVGLLALNAVLVPIRLGLDGVVAVGLTAAGHRRVGPLAAFLTGSQHQGHVRGEPL